MGDDLPFSLWLAMGIPFEVVDRVPGEGYVFLSDFDARDWNAPLARARLVCRQGAVKVPEGVQRMDESLDAVFAFKHQIRGELGETPHVLEDKPAVCAWYPSARKVLVWNLSNVPCSLTLVQRARRISQEYQPLEAKLVNVAPGRR